jgi:CHAD domain-containing protein
MKRDSFYAARYLMDQGRSFEEDALKAVRKPSKNLVHRLRVATRRARAGLSSVPHLDSPAKLAARLRRLGKTLGRLREIDVAIADAPHYGLGTGNLKRRRKKLAADVKSALLKNAAKIERDLKAAAEEMAREKNLRFDFGPLRAKLRKWRERPILKSRDAHKLRIVVKKARYALEIAQADPAPLERLQTLLGKDHDLEVLQELKGPKRVIRKDQKKQRRTAMRFAPRALAFALSQLESR